MSKKKIGKIAVSGEVPEVVNEVIAEQAMSNEEALNKIVERQNEANLSDVEDNVTSTISKTSEASVQDEIKPKKSSSKSKIKTNNSNTTTKKKIKVAYADDETELKVTDNVESSKDEQVSDTSGQIRNLSDHVTNTFKPRKKLSFALLLLPLLLAIAGIRMLTFSKQYQGRVMPGTSFLGEDLGGKTFDESDKIIADRVSAYKTNLMYDGQTKQVDSASSGLSFDVKSAQDQVKMANRDNLLAKILGNKKQDVAIASTFDLGKLKKYLAEEYKDGSVAKDAEIYYDEESASYKVAGEIIGVGVDSNVLSQQITSDANTLKSEPIVVKLTQVKPTISSATLNATAEKVNAILNTSVTINTPSGAWIPDASDKKEWINIALNSEGKDYDINFNDSNIRGYVTYAANSNNQTKEDKSVINAGGSSIVLSNGRDGITINNTDYVAETVINNFHVGNPVASTFTFDRVPMGTTDFAQVNGRWIYVDLSQFRTYAYEGNNLVNSFPMSSGAPNFPTVTGVFNVWSKVRTQTMVGGSGAPGDPTYSVPNVEWIAYFYGSYALHGVWWHNAFGYSNRSHGCVGMSNENAQWIYNFVSIGTPVVVVP